MSTGKKMSTDQFPPVLPEQFAGWRAAPEGTAGPARTPEGGIFFSISSIKTFRECQQKFLFSRIHGLRRKLTEDYFTLGGLYGAATAEWLRSRSLSKVVDAIAVEVQKRVPNRKALLPDEEDQLKKMEQITTKWTRSYAEHYPSLEWKVVKNEWGFVVPMGKHQFLGFVDTLWKRGDDTLAIREAKTTKTKDLVGFVDQYGMNDQILGYTGAFIEKTGNIFPETILDICVKPGTKFPWGKGWERFRKVDPTFHMHNLMPLAPHIQLWKLQSAVTADQIAWLLDEDPTGSRGMWTRNYQSCYGAFFSSKCQFYELCMRGGKDAMEGLVKREASPTDDPRKMLEMAGEAGKG